MNRLYSEAGVSVFKFISLLLFWCSAEVVLSQELCLKRNWTDTSPTPSPVGRQKHALAFDSARGKTVLFGGSDVITFRGTNEIYGDTWEFAGDSWQQRFPAHSPSARYGHAMTYDAGRGVTILFGGRGQGGDSNDVWEWNGNDWSQVPVTGDLPEARAFHGMAYDSARGVHVMYGGSMGGSKVGDTWEYDSTARTWILRASQAAGAGPRFWFQLAFDAARNKTLLFGGSQGTAVQLDDTWVWDGPAGVWTQLNPPAHPSQRQLYMLAYDSSRQLVLLQCGSRVDDTGTLVDRESWEWDGSNWHDLTLTYLYCCPRAGGAMAYDSRLQQMVLFGGSGADEEAIWVLSAVWAGDTVFVDLQNSGTQDGSTAHPFRSVRQASSAASDCSLLSIAAGDYLEGTLALDKPMKLETRNGQVRIH